MKDNSPMLSRRRFITSSGLALLGAAAVSGRAQASAIPEAPAQASPLMQPPLHPHTGPDFL